MRKTVAGAILIAMMTPAMSWAAGLAIPEQGAAAMAMSAAMTGRSEDLSAIFYNPAGLDYVEGSEVFLGLTPIRPGHEFENASESIEAEKKTFLPPQLYAARRIQDNVVLGIGVFAPFGLGTDWDKKWDGRYTSTYGEIQAVYVNPTIAFQMNDMISLGLGVSYVYSTATIEKMVDTGLSIYSAGGSPAQLAPMIANTDYDSHFGLDGTGHGFGFNLGAMIRPMNNLQLGISYRGATDIDYEGDAKFTHKEALKSLMLAPGTSAYDVISARMPLTQDGTATLHLPWMLNIGVLYDLTYEWDVSADFDFVGWSVYDELTIDYQNDLPYDSVTMDKDWSNTFIFRLGSSYDFTDMLTGRCGFLYDETPVPDYTFDGQLPDNDRIGLSLGAGYVIGDISLDVSYMFLSFSDRSKDNLVGYADADANGSVTAGDKALLDGAMEAQNRVEYPVGTGDYDSQAHLFSISASYRF